MRNDDLAVLEQQFATEEPLDRAERRHAVTVDTDRGLRHAELAARLQKTSSEIAAELGIVDGVAVASS